MRMRYKIDKYKDSRRVRPEVLIVVIFLASAALIAGFVYLDLRRNKTMVNESRNQPILGAIESNEVPYKTVTGLHYQVDIPESWIQADGAEVINGGRIFHPDRYEGTAGAEAGRRLDVYVDEVPATLPVAKILRVEISDNRIIPKELSPQCRTFTDTAEENPAGTPTSSRWNDINFTCRTSRVTNTISALETNSADGLLFTTAGGKKYRFAIVFTDHGSDPDNDIFFKILRSFQLN